ncbi:hypothetical protein NDI76_04355 [Halogeometricum sp. S1BR25-6]|uniref:DUF7311 domain-containing protein n=1 Tax=Halogeometricum salsisoli TaxID=2950536 RepID=A0ABU2GAZ8_9EURY|nr:hypothetical protein [Halogeometricum sp. S1BR25-6]MDS0297965.1 hypothetical protein [Halogeometricum sp. S1BR25-6]
MLRVVLAAVLATAVLVASLPAVEDARADRTATALDTSIARLSAAGSALAVGSDATSDPAVAPRRAVVLSLPRPTWTAAAVEYVAVGGSPGGPGNRSVVTYAVEGGGETRRLLSLPVPVRTPGGPVVLRGRGERSVSLSLRATGEGDAPVLVVGRGSRSRT